MRKSITERIRALKERRGAIILAHNYQLPEVQDIADYVGDSLGLSRKAAASEAGVIVFCGVYFMAETASILCPDKSVLIPDVRAGCPMVDMAPVERLLEMKARRPGAVVVSYVNSSAAVKAESDYCCTSANAVDVVESIEAETEIIFFPDKYLGSYVASQTGRSLILYDGYCPTHVRILAADILRLKQEHPGAEVMVHPECTAEVVALADRTLSTGGMCRYARECSSEELIMGTEVGLLHRLRKENPGKRFYPASEAAVCPNMKRIDLQNVLWSLEEMKHEVRVPEAVRARAAAAVDRMVETVKA
ncbi:MAG: quinolinate synthase NadA [Planctomycetes bacterium]|nr:quinolinate synthase NadA [Planctomycetota bacterium]